MFKVFLDYQLLYLPGDPHYCIDNAILDLQLGGSQSFEFTCLQTNPMFERIYNRRSFVQVFRDDKELFFGEVRSQEKDFMGNKKVKCVGLLAFLADSIQPQKEYHNQTPHQLLTAFVNEHNSQVDARKRFTVGSVTVSDPNDSLYRYSNFETTLACIKNKLVNRLGGFLVARHEFNEFYLDWLRLEDIGVLNHQTISFGMNLLDYTENLSADEIVTAVIPLGAEIENQDSNKVLKEHVDIASINNGKNYLVSREALERFGWVCSVQHFDNVTVPSNLLKKGQDFLQDHQFENMTLQLTALDLSILGTQYDNISLGDRIHCIAPPYGMDRIFPIMKLKINLNKPQESKLQLGERIQSSYIEQSHTNYSSLSEEIENNRKVTNSKIQSAVDNLTAQMQGNQGGYKLSEYDSKGRWLRDLYMDTMDKNTATKVLQINMNGIGGSKNGYKGPYNVGMTLDGQILGERIVAGSITGEKLSVEYTSQVQTNIQNAMNNAIASADGSTDSKLQNYYTMKQIDTKFSVTDGKIEASVQSINQDLMQKNGNYYGTYVPSNSNAPANSWNTTELMKLHDGDFFIDTTTGFAYRYALSQEVYKVTFAPECQTESASFDYVKFYYEIDGVSYVSKAYGGNDIANQIVYLPTSTFYVYWNSDSSNNNYYGFRISNIEKVYYPYINAGEQAPLPSGLAAIDITGTNYPESAHNPYPLYETKVWRYTGTQLNTLAIGEWVRIKDSDIDKNNQTVMNAIKDKNGNFYGSYEPSHDNLPAKEWNNDGIRDMHYGDIFYNTTNGYAYRYSRQRECLQINFSSDSQTENVRYDWVQIFYELNGKIYELPKLGGTDIAGATVYVPSTKFYVHWRSDSSNCEYYGFRITSIYKASGTYEDKGVISSLPADVGTRIQMQEGQYPESLHNPYGDNQSTLWEMSSSSYLSSSPSYSWIRVKDMDIEYAKQKAEEAISRITIAEGNITSMVKKGEFGTFMEQNYNSFILGFNNASRYVQIHSGQIDLYNGDISLAGKRASFDQNGLHFYRDSKYVGNIGTNVMKNNTNVRGLVFDLSYAAQYMCFAYETSSTSSEYVSIFTFSRANTFYQSFGLHVGCDIDLHNYRLLNPKWDTGFGITATINYVQVLEVNPDGTLKRWGSKGRMVFKNGILMDLTFY